MKMKWSDTVENPKQDYRLRSQKFRNNVNLVMDYLEIIFQIKIDRTIGNFKKYDKIIDWKIFAQNILSPTKTAKVYPIWRDKPISKWITVNLSGRTRAEAIKKLDTKLYEFVEWA